MGGAKFFDPRGGEVIGGHYWDVRLAVADSGAAAACFRLFVFYTGGGGFGGCYCCSGRVFWSGREGEEARTLRWMAGENHVSFEVKEGLLNPYLELCMLVSLCTSDAVENGLGMNGYSKSKTVGERLFSFQYIPRRFHSAAFDGKYGCCRTEQPY